MRATDKIVYVTKKIYCLTAGGAAHCQIVTKYVRYYLDMHS